MTEQLNFGSVILEIVYMFHWRIKSFQASGRERQRFKLKVNWFSSVQSLSHVWLFATSWTAACQASLSITTSQSLLKLMSFKLVMPSNHLILRHPLLLLPLIFPSIRVFSNESVLCFKWPKYWSFNISPFNEYSGLISFRMDWLVLLAVQGTLKSLVQHHSSKASISSAFNFVYSPTLTSIHDCWKKPQLWPDGHLLAK